MPWLFVKSLFGLARWIWALLILAMILLIWITLRDIERKDDANNRSAGAVVERNTSLENTVKRNEEGNKAREEIRSPGVAGSSLRYDQCLQSTRAVDPAASCRRLLPEQPAGNDGNVP